MIVDDIHLEFPLKLDNGNLYLWVKYKLNGNDLPSPLFAALEQADIYRHFGQNQVLLARLNKLLELDFAVIDMRLQMNYFWLLKLNPFHKKVRQADGARLQTLLTEREKAYGEYEMLRKLSFNTAEGNVFKIHLS